MAWWSLAGVDCPVSEEPMHWLRPVPTPSSRVAAAAPAEKADTLPDTLEAFHTYLASATNLPEAKWPGRRIMPVGAVPPQLMIIVDVPEMGSEHSGTHYTQASQRLLDDIVRALHIAPDQCYIASLALVRPAGGSIDPATLHQLTERMRHHIALAAPKEVLLLGDRTNRALVGADGAATSRFLPFINHATGTVPGVATCHPVLMLEQPAAKVECWRALQQLMVQTR